MITYSELVSLHSKTQNLSDRLCHIGTPFLVQYSPQMAGAPLSLLFLFLCSERYYSSLECVSTLWYVSIYYRTKIIVTLFNFLKAFIVEDSNPVSSVQGLCCSTGQLHTGQQCTVYAWNQCEACKSSQYQVLEDYNLAIANGHRTY